jgi:glycogen(starch) synthase
MTTDAVGGVWHYATDLASELSRRGFAVLLASMGPLPSEQQRVQISKIPNVQLRVSDFALEWMPSPWDDVDRASDWLIDLESEFKPDLIQINGYAHAALGWRRPVLTVAHSCVCSWWRAVKGESAGAEWAEYKARVLAGLRASSVIVAPSWSMAESLRREYDISKMQVRVIHNFSRVLGREKVKKEPFYLASGRSWDPAKNFAVLEQIASLVPWPIRLAGSNQDAQNKTASVRSLLHLGVLPHSELMKQMERASIFVHPSLYEPFGLAVLEAATVECCLVLADIPSLRELWDGAAMFLDPRKADDWALELSRLALQADRRTALGREAFDRAQKYGAEKSIQQYVQLYRQLAELGEDTAA